MAQTTRLASFGPVIVVTAFMEPFRTFRTSTVPIHITYYKKNTKREKKDSLRAQTTRDALFGPLVRRCVGTGGASGAIVNVDVDVDVVAVLINVVDVLVDVVDVAVVVVLYVSWR
jgi:hypothetical protein